ncbi:unnamed protein product [Clonostachys rosea f. rosea IK726]|uniref:Uncharacterized protein n=1 Tax=Clonostachys rosea f. rosea IK726 TaxID=1349383 RepID=A0ACA9TPA0_BIOOC|nr:unnamed protein product [Clonostachys rosea f. rosea IK726]
MSSYVKIAFLIVGAGPSGATLASCLGQNGLKGMVISDSMSTADTPRAHAVNPAAMECLRDLGLEDDCLRMGITGKPLQSFRWCKSFAGEEFGKILAWGGHPRNAHDIAIASPCRYLDLPQSYMEPILVKYASHHNFEVSFRNELVHAQQVPEGVLCDIKNLTTGHCYQILTKVLFGGDGGRSQVARSFPFKFDKRAAGGVSCNLLIEADAEHIVPGREAELHFVANAGRQWRFGIGANLRMVRPYKLWLLTIIAPDSDVNPIDSFTTKSPELIEYVKEVFGDNSIDIKILRKDPWTIRETVAESYSLDGKVFLVGDAAHRHPPAFGLGSNISIADSYNLAWKVAYVHKGLAGKELLDTYTKERQPVGVLVVKITNEGYRDINTWREFGVLAPTAQEGIEDLEKLYLPNHEGVQRRMRIHDAFEDGARVAESIGVALNTWYTSSAVYLNDESNMRPELAGDFITKPLISTYPGIRLPHAWLDISTRKKEISTHDLAGHGSFCLLTGVGGTSWINAARKVAETTGIPINAYSIGFGCDYHDVYRDWYRWREVNEDGCVLVRPDRVVCWRAFGVVPNCEEKLSQVLDQILSRKSQ